jgi:hypothetical protein
MQLTGEELIFSLVAELRRMRHYLFESGISATDGRRADLQTSFIQLFVGVTF